MSVVVLPTGRTLFRVRPHEIDELVVRICHRVHWLLDLPNGVQVEMRSDAAVTAENARVHNGAHRQRVEHVPEVRVQVAAILYL